MKPYWILRHHGSSSIRSLHHHPRSGLLAVGDDAGHVSLIDLRTLRPVWRWAPHSDSLLTVVIVGEDADHVVTHARDNSLKLWKLPRTPPSMVSSSEADSREPELVRTIGVNALNFSKCAIHQRLVAVPNALDAAYIDVLDLYTGVRLHEAIGRPDIKRAAGDRLPIVMSLHLLSDAAIAGYEDGWIKKWSLSTGDLLWQCRGHSESVMSISLCDESEPKFGMSVAADDRIAKFDLDTGSIRLTQTKTPGKASVVIAPAGRTFAVGGWDGSIRIYATADLKELGQLRYHRDTVEALAFANARTGDESAEEESNDEDQEGQDDASDRAGATELILAAGGRDGKISLWKYH